jgi:hypothetical protein
MKRLLIWFLLLDAVLIPLQMTGVFSGGSSDSAPGISAAPTDVQLPVLTGVPATMTDPCEIIALARSLGLSQGEYLEQLEIASAGLGDGKKTIDCPSLTAP